MALPTTAVDVQTVMEWLVAKENARAVYAHAKKYSHAATWRDRVAAFFEWLAHDLRDWDLATKSGKLLRAQSSGRNLGYPVWKIYSVRGGMFMGTIEFSNQWRRPRFKADGEAIFDRECVAEIYAMMREFK